MIIRIVLIIIIIITIFILFKNISKEKLFVKKKGLNTFSKVMYINLKHRKDRKKQILNELKRVGIKKHKIIRIDAAHEKLNGHIGCAKSHIKTIELAKKMELKNVIVFEDDFIFTTDKEKVNKLINKFLENYDNNWDMIQLTTVHKRLQDIPDNNYIKKVNSATTSSAYIIQNHFYDKLLDNLKESVSKMEKEMEIWKINNKDKKKHQTGYALDQHWGNLQEKSKWYIFYPYLGKQGGDAGSSSIMGKIDAFFDFSNRAIINKMYV